MLKGRAVVSQWCRTAHRGAILGGERIDRLAADALILAARQALVGIRRHALLIGAEKLKPERRRAGVEDENVHALLPTDTPSRAAAARARASASSGVSPSAEMCPIFRPGRATRLPYRWSRVSGSASVASKRGVSPSVHKSPNRFTIAAGLTIDVSPRGRSQTARTSCSNWLVGQASSVS